MLPTFVLLATLSALGNAHSDPRDARARLPKLVGGSKFLASLKERSLLSETVPSVIKERGLVKTGPQLKARFTQTCGPGVGNCDAGYCCSAAGYCGTTEAYCAAPDCQFQYGPACDANIRPAGALTSSIARPNLGSIPYGGADTAGVQDCIKNGVIAFSYDDGPYLYTKDLLDLLDFYGAKATFFIITGNNLGKGEIDNCSTGYPQLIKRMYNSGHQVASHTWSHQDLDTLTTEQFNNQVYYNEMAFRNILGVIPTYLRPPYSSCNTTCSGKLKTMGYHATYFDLDTEGYLNDSPELIQNSKNIYINTTTSVDPATNDFLLIEHDIHYQSVYNLTQFILETMAAQGWGAPVTVGECLNDPEANWYRSAGPTIATCAAGTYTGVDWALFASQPTAAITFSLSSTSPSSAATSTTARSSSSTKSTTSSSSATRTTTITSTVPTTISTDGSCGGTVTCQGSSFGNCCSQHSWCGSTSAYCGTGCQAAFGTCGSSPSSLSSSSSRTSNSTSTTTSIPAVSADGSCGGTGKNTCLNSTFGNCCSQYGWCGNTSAYCGTGCQAGFGTCS